jgi:YHS domain-containing protein
VKIKEEKKPQKMSGRSRLGCHPGEPQTRSPAMHITDLISQHRVFSAAAMITVALVLALSLFLKTKKVSPVGWGLFGAFNAQEGVALGGHDPISYQEGGPLLGSATHQSQWQGVTWRFASPENKARFDAAPEKYAPANGGFCSFAVSRGFTANANPQSYLVKGERLFVFDSDAMKEKFVAGLSDNVARSQQNWSLR